jgi:hypothetical protein
MRCKEEEAMDHTEGRSERQYRRVQETANRRGGCETTKGVFLFTKGRRGIFGEGQSIDG